MLPRVFDLFTQVDRSLEKTTGGLGIGLTLVERLVAMHGGSVEARSEGLLKGSEFIVRLPLQLVPPRAETTASPPLGDAAIGGGSSIRRILVVDDNQDAADSLSAVLRLRGHEVRTAYDGLAAVEAAGLFTPEVTFLDIGLPRLNGYEVARRIREHDWGKRMYLIALTGWGQPDDRAKAREAGFDRHLTKPVDPGLLEQVLLETSVHPPPR
jgi:CheY-like chemotaxis protein